jgi:hypothetical protein
VATPIARLRSVGNGGFLPVRGEEKATGPFQDAWVTLQEFTQRHHGTQKVRRHGMSCTSQRKGDNKHETMEEIASRLVNLASCCFVLVTLARAGTVPPAKAS